MADDAGALLVRSGLVSSNALDDARARVAGVGGTLGEQLVTSGAITDDDLTAFYRSRLLVPQINPNLLARLTPKVVATIPSDMAIELRAIPVSLDGENNLTVAMSDPSDRHAVDEIAFFTGAYVVRAVATQMQIAWCLAHYYGHVTALGQRLLYASDSGGPDHVAASASSPPSRAKDSTGKVEAADQRASAPVAGQADAPGPSRDIRPPAAPAPAPAMTQAGTSASSPPSASASALSPTGAVPFLPRTPTPPTPISLPASSPRIAPPPSRSPAVPDEIDDRTPIIIEIDGGDVTPTDSAPAAKPAPPPDVPPASDGTPDRPRAHSASGEIRVPGRRAASIKPPMPEPDGDGDDEEPVIVIEPGAPEDDSSGPPTQPPRRRAVKSDPPELYARAGEVDLKSGADRSIDTAEPRIVIDEDALAPPAAARPIRAVTPGPAATPVTAMEVLDDTDSGALIHDRIVDNESQPILLERPRATPDQLRAAPGPAAPTHATHDDDGTDDSEVVVLQARKPRSRPERRTQVGIPPVPVPVTRMHRDTEASGAPAMLETTGPDRTPVDEDATTLDLHPAPAASSSGRGPDDQRPRSSTPRPAVLPSAVVIDDDDDDDDDDDEQHAAGSPRTSVMSAAKLDSAIPESIADAGPVPSSRRRIDHDPIDDGWGPPGTTIPPPLLGAIPGSEDDDDLPSAIPVPDVEVTPLVVTPPSRPAAGDTSGRALVRALEEATARAIEVIRQLEHAESRDQVVEVMVTHLAENHHRAGFFVIRPGAVKGVTELSLFALMPRPPVMPFATLRLDRPSTLQDVVGTRLPYRGPMHDDASRTFLISVLGACPPEILLVPVAVRERVVGVLFGEHRQRHTFDDQLALAARAAGMALERILKAKRG